MRTTKICRIYNSSNCHESIRILINRSCETDKEINSKTHKYEICFRETIHGSSYYRTATRQAKYKRLFEQSRNFYDKSQIHVINQCNARTHHANSIYQNAIRDTQAF